MALYLKGLEGEAHVEARGHRDLPHAHFVGPVVVGVVGRLDLPVVLPHLSATDRYASGRRERS